VHERERSGGSRDTVERRLDEGDIVSVDCGVRLNGYCGDSAVTLPDRKVSHEFSACSR